MDDLGGLQFSLATAQPPEHKQFLLLGYRASKVPMLSSTPTQSCKNS